MQVIGGELASFEQQGMKGYYTTMNKTDETCEHLEGFGESLTENVT